VDETGFVDYLKSLPLHPSQEVLHDSEDEFRIKLRLRITPDFIMEILSRGWSLKVIQPDSLRERVCEICRSAMERNR
jgi:predicted DNA-binding transcriptional regulator YafY